MTMKKLDEPYRDLMYKQRKNRMLNFDNLAIILNCTKDQMLSAQIGRDIPDDVYGALIDWLEGS